MTIEAKIVPLLPPNPELKRIIPQLEDILSPEEAKLLQQVEQGMLPCPCCGQRMEGGKVVIEGVYEGVLLSCSNISDCGFVEG